MIAYHTKWYMNTDDSIVFKNLRDLIFFQTSMDSFRWLPCLDLKNCWNVSSSNKHFPRNQNISKTKTFRDISFRKQSLLSRQMVHLRECKRRENKHSPRYSCFFLRALALDRKREELKHPIFKEIMIFFYYLKNPLSVMCIQSHSPFQSPKPWKHF